VEVEVREARPTDQDGIRAVHVAAFPTALEADLVEQLQRDGDAMLSLVAAEGEHVLGHILMSRMTAEGDGRPLRAVGLAPVAVLPDRQKEGIGGRLVEAAVDRMRDDGEQLVFLVGEPAYYARFGFAAATAAPFASPYAGPYLMALALNGTPLPESGRVDYAPAFADLE
jgi:putative acetyltransferase